MRNIFLLLLSISLSFILFACEGDNLSNEGVKYIDRANFLPDKEVQEYISSQAFEESPKSHKGQLLLEAISEKEVPEVSKSFWKYWTDAHQEMLSDMGFDILNSYKDITYKIPQEERMRMVRIFKGEQPSDGYPLVINLHGGGRYPNVNYEWGSEINSDEWATLLNFTNTENRYGNAPTCYIIPRMADDRKGRWYFAPQIYIFKKIAQLAMLSEHFNKEKIYLTGISEGGYGTLRLGMFMPDYFAALGVLAAAESPNGSEINLRNVAFRMEVGEFDYEYSRNTYAYYWQDKMKELKSKNPENFTHNILIQKGRDHYIKYFDALPWMKEYTRNAIPNRVSYLYANIAPSYDDINGRFSDGVYFLDFRGLKTTSKKDQMLFDVIKNGNIYNISTETVFGKISGKLSIFIDKIDRDKPIKVILNGKTVLEEIIPPTRGAIAESIVLYGDPKRIYSRKITIDI